MAKGVVRNLDEVQAAFLEAGDELRKQRRLKIGSIVQPVVTEIESLTVINTKATGQWANFRMGVGNSVVWVAPVARGTKDERRKRRKFADLLLNRAMIPALNHHTERIVRDFDQLLARMEAKFQRG